MVFRNCTIKASDKIVDFYQYKNLAISQLFKMEKCIFFNVSFQSMVVINFSTYFKTGQPDTVSLHGWPSNSCHKYTTDQQDGMPS